MRAWHVTRPASAYVARYLADQRDRAVTYTPVGVTRGGDPAPPGFVLDHNRQRLGTGDAAFGRAREALRRWQMFPEPWTAIEPADAPIAEGAVIAVHVHALGVWWLNAARIVYALDEPRRFGFAYGTLPGHAECGEERFVVEQLGDGGVWYDLRAVSRPRYWGARLAYPVTRALQRRFARASKAQLAARVGGGVPVRRDRR